MTRTLLMPKATAVWLVDHTALTFEQIAEFCGLHVLEVKGIADGDVAQGIRGLDPINGGQVARQEIERGEADPAYRPKMAPSRIVIPDVKTGRRPRYTPLSPPPGSAEGDPLAFAPPSRAEGQSGYSPGWYDKADDSGDPGTPSLELGQSDPSRSRHPRFMLADGAGRGSSEGGASWRGGFRDAAQRWGGAERHAAPRRRGALLRRRREGRAGAFS